MAPIALAFGVLELTGDAARVGQVLACQVGAQVAVQLLGGALADRGSRKLQMVRADLLAGATLVAVAYLLLTGRPSVIVLGSLMAVVGVALALHAPAATGLVPQVVDDAALRPANALLGIARHGSLTLGASAGGVIVASAGAGWAIAVDAGTFLVSAALVSTLRPKHQRRWATLPLWRELRAGWTEFTSHTWLWTIVAQFSVMMIATEGTFGVIGPTVAKRSLGGAEDWGLVMAAVGVGMLIGGLLAMRLHVRRPMRTIVLLCLGFALPQLALLGPSPVAVIACCGVANGICASIFITLWNTELQRRVAPEALSRVSAYDHVGSMALAPVGVVLAGSLLEAVGPRPTLCVAVGLVIVPTLFVLCVREVRELQAFDGARND